MSAALRVTALLLLLVGGTSARQAQQETQTIRPGMTQEEVRAVFGQPDSQRMVGQFAYYFYDNGCLRVCGFPDLVIFQGGQVIDAVLRADWRRYEGTSSSPKGVQPKRSEDGERLRTPGQVQDVEVRPAGMQNDTARAAPDTAESDTTTTDSTRSR